MKPTALHDVPVDFDIPRDSDARPPSSASDSAVVIAHLTKYYDRFKAVDDLSLTVHVGELFGFLGPNGAGKTTSLMMLNGLLKPSSGTVTIFGHDIEKQALACKRLMAFIPDRPYLYEKLTGYELLAFMDELYDGSDKTRRARCSALLERFGLLSFANELVEGYSHGMKQRLVFASALIHQPRLLVVDEPMVGLDPQGARLVKDVFREVCRNGGTVLMSTHTLQVAEEVCDRIAIIQSGHIIALGTMAELRRLARQETDHTLEDIFLTLTNDPQTATTQS